MFQHQPYVGRPVIVFSDIKIKDLICILDYVYNGEVNIPESQLNSFVNAVLALQVKGFMLDSSATTFQTQAETQENIPTTSSEADANPNQQLEPKSLLEPHDNAESVPVTSVKTSATLSCGSSKILNSDVFFGNSLEGKSSQLLEQPTSESTSLLSADSLNGTQDLSLNLETDKSEHFATPEGNDDSEMPEESLNEPCQETSRASSSKHKRRQTKLPQYLQSFELKDFDNTKTLRCEFCGKSVQGQGFEADDKLKKHKIKCTSNPEYDQRFKTCPHCQKVLALKNFENHVKVHEDPVRIGPC